MLGGSGQSFDWELVRALATRRPLMLAGGLTPHNVTLAVESVRPAWVDVRAASKARSVRAARIPSWCAPS